jgi:hypothetical protein
VYGLLMRAAAATLLDTPTVAGDDRTTGVPGTSCCHLENQDLTGTLSLGCDLRKLNGRPLDPFG